MMRITKVEFAHCVGMKSQLPEPTLPEIAFAGRSNVGKSSLLNCLIKRKALARTSSQPGKTQTLNFYLVNDSFFLVDLPGYGFAKVSQAIKNQWKVLLEHYLTSRETLKGVALVVDSRHPPAASDQQMYAWLRHYNKPLFVIATKVDKLLQRERKFSLDRIASAYKEVPVLPFSSVKGEGQEEVWRQIQNLMRV